MNFYYEHTLGHSVSKVHITNTDFISNICDGSTTQLTKLNNNSLIRSNLMLYLDGPIVFSNNTGGFLLDMKTNSLITLETFSITFHGYVEFSTNNADIMINGFQNLYFVLLENVVLNISFNNISKVLFNNDLSISRRFHSIPKCYFQFFGKYGNIKTNNIY